jgi:hypothetical protein
MTLRDLATDHAEAVATRIVVKYPMWIHQAKAMIRDIAAAIRAANPHNAQER